MPIKTCLHVHFWRASFYPANQSNLKNFKALIGWKKAGPPINHYVFGHVNRLNIFKYS